jgi:hypothetical protein
MTAICKTIISPLKIELRARPSSLDPELFSSDYYLIARHVDDKRNVAFSYVGNNEEHALRQYDRAVERAEVEAAILQRCA